ncbi:odorant receptor 131-2-like [Gastrophryne carolinensis]
MCLANSYMSDFSVFRQSLAEKCKAWVDTMVNLTSDDNITQLSLLSSKATETIRTCLLVVMIFGFCFFLYFIKILLKVYFTNHHIRDNSRYVLYAHMLLTDTVYLLTCFLLSICSVYLLYLPFFVCFTFVSTATTSFIVTLYNLAVMSLERYVAVCSPLRHSQICSLNNTCIAMALMWVLGLISPVADFLALMIFLQKDHFALKVQCSYITVTLVPAQNSIKSLNIVMSLTAVGTVHLYTYIKVIMVAKKINSDMSPASRAGRTVMLHAFQLLLCMTSMASSFIDMVFKDDVVFLRMMFFLFFMCLPRFLSPLIYGLRDEVFRKYLRREKPKLTQ